ncbi:MAG: hypothetical protein WCS42_13885 [Verrucomicrobiota bacterium]
MKKAPLLVVLVFLYCIASAQSFDECVQLFQSNKYTEAITGLERLQKDGATSKDASLLETIIQFDQAHYNEAIEPIKAFLQKSDNPYPYFYALHRGGLFNAGPDNVREFLEKMLTLRLHRRQSPEQTAVGAVSSAVAVRVASWWWLLSYVRRQRAFFYDTLLYRPSPTTKLRN